ncbi:3-oxoacyl-[acyl-carrier-protein] reductase FabG-like [Sitodiplosis mosellana]|uniref:3-oxoacyl-[acyl-carrier-protein] reductase FabG-like n=1 Tax=Sitodiplosis mosellana TaxID=263140 RepID=UPI002444C63A|nr:3-oxoacyl-[acyl-carrier-protein] reductase FabG-like [Sitodiplosis mosellana]
MSFTGKVVIVTGASSGIGADAALHLAKLGAKVSIVGRNEKRVNEVADQIKKSDAPTPLPIVADVSKDAQRIINETVKHFGRLDVLVNNAGIFRADNVVQFDVKHFDSILDTNLRSVIILTNLAVPHLEKTKGNIINISSVCGLRPFDLYTSYCISKAGLDQFTKCSAIALAPKGIRVNSINPATIRTPIFEQIGINESNENQFYEDRKHEFLVDRVGEVSDTSSAIAYLASETFLTGVLLPIDGGLMCSGIRINLQQI